MRFDEVAEPVHEPLGRKIGRCADREHTGILPLQQPLGADRNPVQRVAHDQEIVAAGLRDDEPLALAVEQLDAKPVLQTFHLLAHCTLSDAQLLGSTRKALVPGRSLEGLQIVEWRQAWSHRSTSLVNLSLAPESMVCQQSAGQSIESSTQAFHVLWSLSMRTLTLSAINHGFRVHQKN